MRRRLWCGACGALYQPTVDGGAGAWITTERADELAAAGPFDDGDDGDGDGSYARRDVDGAFALLELCECGHDKGEHLVDAPHACEGERTAPLVSNPARHPRGEPGPCRCSGFKSLPMREQGHPAGCACEGCAANAAAWLRTQARLADLEPLNVQACAGCGVKGSVTSDVPSGFAALHWEVRGQRVCIDCHGKEKERPYSSFSGGAVAGTLTTKGGRLHLVKP
jgi:hypothetical protein